MSEPGLNEDILRAAAGVLAEHGWHGLTLERVAFAAGVSRVTLYRRGVSKESLVAALADRAAQGWQAAMWPALTGPGSGAERLHAALHACCTALELHLPLVAALESAPQTGAGPGTNPDLGDLTPIAGQVSAATTEVYIAPFERLLRDGAADTTLAEQPDPAAAAVLLFSIVPRTYLRLRTVHGWEPDRAAALLNDLVLRGLLPRSPRLGHEDRSRP